MSLWEQIHQPVTYAIPFFALHFGGFCAVHGLFIMALFELLGGPGAVFAEASSSGLFVFFELLGAVLRSLWSDPPPAFRWLVFGLLASHGISFVDPAAEAAGYLPCIDRISLSFPHAPQFSVSHQFSPRDPSVRIAYILQSLIPDSPPM